MMKDITDENFNMKYNETKSNISRLFGHPMLRDYFIAIINMIKFKIIKQI